MPETLCAQLQHAPVLKRSCCTGGQGRCGQSRFVQRAAAAAAVLFPEGQTQADEGLAQSVQLRHRRPLRSSSADHRRQSSYCTVGSRSKTNLYCRLATAHWQQLDETDRFFKKRPTPRPAGSRPGSNADGPSISSGERFSCASDWCANSASFNFVLCFRASYSCVSFKSECPVPGRVLSQLFQTISQNLTNSTIRHSHCESDSDIFRHGARLVALGTYPDLCMRAADGGRVV